MKMWKTIVAAAALVLASGSAAFAVIEHAPQLGALLPHRAGDVSPETAAEQFGLFDQLSRGRLAIKILPPSASAFEEKHDAHERALESLDEYLTVLKRLWASDDPFDFEAHHHRVVGERRRQGEHLGQLVGVLVGAAAEPCGDQLGAGLVGLPPGALELEHRPLAAGERSGLVLHTPPV